MDSGRYEFRLATVGVFLLMFFSLFVIFACLCYINKYGNYTEEDEEDMEHESLINVSVRSEKKLSPKKSRRDDYISI